jgi:SAM-dependent methyltransferase
MRSTSFYDARYAEPGFAYGDVANDFLVEVTPRLRERTGAAGGAALSLGEGEGRNARHLARAGFAVTAVDASAVGLAKTRARAEAEALPVTTVLADLAAWEIAPAAWDAVVAIFCHLPPTLRAEVHRSAVRGLRPGGAFVLEAYTPAQLAHGTGGPQDPAMLYTLDGLRDELGGLELAVAREVTRDLHEGRYHHGASAVVQVLGFRR